MWTAGTISRSLEPRISLGERFDLFLGDDKRTLAIAEPLQQNLGRFGELRLRAFEFLELALLQAKRIFELALPVVGRTPLLLVGGSRPPNRERQYPRHTSESPITLVKGYRKTMVRPRSGFSLRPTRVTPTRNICSAFYMSMATVCQRT